MKTGFLLAMLAFTIGRAFAQDVAQNRPSVTVEKILSTMPENNDRRCLGISVVAAALSEGQRLDGDDCDTVDELAKRIYDAAFTKARIQFHSALCLDTNRVPITSQEGLNALSTAVADRYKQRYFEMIATPDGRKKLSDAEANVLKSRRELDALLDGDPDHLVAFAVTGVRRFPDGDVKDTNHVILIAKDADGEKVVFDPNDRGTRIPCRIQTSDEGLLITWTCRFRATGIRTTQQYRIIEIDRYFREALAGE